MKNRLEKVRLADIDLEDTTFMSRLDFDSTTIRLIAEDIEKWGQRNPVGLRPKVDKFQLIYGWERTKGLMLLGRETINAIIYEDISEEEAQIHNISDNIRHEDLTPVEIALQIEKLRDIYDWSITKISEFYGGKTQYIYDLLTLLKMRDEIRDAVHSGQVGLTHAIELNKHTDDSQLEVLQKSISHGFSVAKIKAIRKGEVKIPKTVVEDLAQKIIEANQTGEAITVDQLERLSYELEFNRLLKFIDTQVCPQDELKPELTRDGVAKWYVEIVKLIAEDEDWNLPTLSDRINTIMFNNIIIRSRGCPNIKDYNFTVYPGTKTEYDERAEDWDRYVSGGLRTDNLSRDMRVWLIKEMAHYDSSHCKHEWRSFYYEQDEGKSCIHCNILKSYKYTWEDPPFEAPPASNQLEIKLEAPS